MQYNYSNPEDEWEDIEFDRFIIRNARHTNSRLFGSLALYSLLSYVVTFGFVFIMYTFFPGTYGMLFDTVLGTYTLNAVVLYLICLPIFYLSVRKMETRRLWKRKFGFKEFFGLFAISQLLMTVGNYIGIFFNARIESFFQIEIKNSTSELIGSSPIWMMLLFSVILAPIAEEILMRKLIIDRLSKFGSGFALLMSSVAFGLFHGNFYQFFYAVFLGLVLGYLYIRGGLKYSILMHMLINFMGSVVSVLYIDAANAVLAASAAGTEARLIDMITVMLYSCFNYGLLLYGAVLLFIYFRKGKISLSHLDDARMKIPKGKVASSVFLNVGTVAFLVISTLALIESIFI